MATSTLVQDLTDLSRRRRERAAEQRAEAKRLMDFAISCERTAQRLTTDANQLDRIVALLESKPEADGVAA